VEVTRGYFKRAAGIDELQPPGFDGPITTALMKYNGGRLLIFAIV